MSTQLLAYLLGILCLLSIRHLYFKHVKQLHTSLVHKVYEQVHDPLDTQQSDEEMIAQVIAQSRFAADPGATAVLKDNLRQYMQHSFVQSTVHGDSHHPVFSPRPSKTVWSAATWLVPGLIVEALGFHYAWYVLLPLLCCAALIIQLKTLKVKKGQLPPHFYFMPRITFNLSMNTKLKASADLLLLSNLATLLPLQQVALSDAELNAKLEHASKEVFNLFQLCEQLYHKEFKDYYPMAVCTAALFDFYSQRLLRKHITPMQ